MTLKVPALLPRLTTLNFRLQDVGEMLTSSFLLFGLTQQRQRVCGVLNTGAANVLDSSCKPCSGRHSRCGQQDRQTFIAVAFHGDKIDYYYLSYRIPYYSMPILTEISCAPLPVLPSAQVSKTAETPYMWWGLMRTPRQISELRWPPWITWHLPQPFQCSERSQAPALCPRAPHHR